jgi:hypothetical protein
MHLTMDRALALPLVHRVELIALGVLCLVVSTVMKRADAAPAARAPDRDTASAPAER